MLRTPLFLNFAYLRTCVPGYLTLLVMVLGSNFLFGQLINNGEICGNGFDDNGVNGIDENCSRCNNKQDNIWYFGFGAGLDFNSGALVPLTGLTGSQPGAGGFPITHIEGCATASDANGQLLFYTDGLFVWDRSHNMFPDPIGNLTTSSTEAAVIVPNPNNPLQYFIVAADELDGQLGLRIAATMTFSMAFPFGELNVLTANNQLIPSDNSTEKLVLARHANCKDYWVISHTFTPFNVPPPNPNITGDEYFAYHVDGNFSALTVPEISNTGTVHTNVNLSTRQTGQLAISQQNDRIANAILGTNIVDVSDFNAGTGEIGVIGTISLTLPLLQFERVYGVNFSSNGNFLYVSVHHLNSPNSRLFRFDLTSPNPPAIDISADISAQVPNVSGDYGQILPTPSGQDQLAMAVDGLGILLIDGSNTPTPIYTLIPLVGTSIGLSATIPDYCELSTTVNIISPAPYCVGSLVTVTANPIGGALPYTYNWNTGQNTNQITATIPFGINPIYQVTVTDATGCTATASIAPNITPNITINKTVGTLTGAPPQIGQTITYSIIICNYQPFAQTIQVTDILPSSLVPVNLNGFAFNGTTGTLSQSITLAGSKSPPVCTTLVFVARVVGALCGPTSNSIVNTATATVIGGFCPPVSATATITIGGGGGLNNITIGSGVGIPTVTAAILAGKLLQIPNAQILQQKIKVKGTLIVDASYPFTNGSEILMDAGAMIWIEHDKVLFLNNTHVHGCQKMWQAINVRTGGFLYALNSLIEDGEYAVAANNESKIILLNTVFTKNYVGVFAGKNPAKPIKDIYIEIQGCTFQGGTSFLQKYPGQATNPNSNGWSFAGIQLHEVRSFNLISPTAPNIFQNMNAGILASDVKLDISDAIFRDMHIGYPTLQFTPTTLAYLNNNIGIYAESTTGGHQFFQKGFGSAATRSFENCRFGIITRQMTFEIADNNMNNIDVGIGSMNAQGQKGAIHGNILTNCNIGGVWMWQNDPMKGLSIYENDISMVRNTAFASLGGIILDENSNTPAGIVFVERNQINLLNTRRGISLQNQHNGLISENFIELANAAATPLISFPNRTGIFSGGGKSQSLSCNIIRGGSFNNGFDLNLIPAPFSINNQNINNFGIEIDISPENIYTCNDMDNVLSGMRFTGNCNSSTLEQNIFGFVSRGIEVLQGSGVGTSSIGVQLHGQNRWTFNPLSVPGFPALIQPLDLVGARNTTLTPIASLFTVDPGQDPEFLPFSVIPTLNFFTSGFNNDPILPACSGFTCFGIPRPAVLDPFDQMVTSGTFQSPFFPQTAEFEANAITYHKLKKNPSLAPSGSTAAAFVQNMNNRCEGDFYTVAEQTKALYTIPTTLQNQLNVEEAQIKTGLDDIYRLDSLIAVDSTYRDSLQQLIANLSLALQPLMLQHQQNLATAMQIRQQRANVSHTFNNTIAATKLAEQNLKEVNKIYLQTIAKGDINFNSGQVNKLHNIALQCPAEGGSAVYKARAMITFVTQLDYAELQSCSSHNGHGNGNGSGHGNGNSARLAQDGTSINLYPNPANEFVTLEWKLTEENTNSQFVIYNTLGQPVQETTLQGSTGQTNINISNLPVGFYLCKIYANGEAIDSQKLIIVR